MESNDAEAHGSDTGTPLVHPGDAFASPGGTIQNLGVCGYVSHIETGGGQRRSSHWHRTDHHWLYVDYGCMEYYWRPVGSTKRPRMVLVRQGQMVFTPPNVEHWTYFREFTKMISVSKLNRTHEQHEADLVRVGWFE